MKISIEEEVIKLVAVLALVDIESQQTQELIARAVGSHKVEIFKFVAAVAKFIHIVLYVKFLLRCI